MANEAGIEVLSGPRDYDKVKRDLDGRRLSRRTVSSVLAVSGNSYIAPISQVGVDQLRKAGMNVDLQIMDFPTLVRRRMSKEPPDKGGWNVYFTIIDGLFNAQPGDELRTSAATAERIGGLARTAQGWRHCAKPGWMRRILDAQKRISEQMQLQMWQDVPYIPMGHWVRSTAHRRNIVDLPWGFAAFYGVRRV